MTIKTIYSDSAIKDEVSARSLITAQQHNFAKARGSAALAQMVADGFVTIQKVWANLSDQAQATILDEHKVAPAGKGTSRFTPWVKVLWGEHHPTDTFVDTDGNQRRLWLPDRSMEVYHHTMQELEELGVTRHHAKVIIEHGGALSMAMKRKARLRTGGQPVSSEDEQIKRDLFLRETSGQWIDVTIPLPVDAGDYVTVVCRREEGRLQLLGVANKDARSELTKLACESYAGLLSGLELRKLEERIRAEASREAEQKFVEMDPAMIKRMYAKIQERGVSA